MEVAAVKKRLGHRQKRPASRRGDAGLISLDWLLLIAATVGMGAVTAAAVEMMVDQRVDTGYSVAERVIQAEIAAARLEDRSDMARRSNIQGKDPANYKQWCEDDLLAEFSDVLELNPGGWDRSQQATVVTGVIGVDDPETFPIEYEVDDPFKPARCKLKLQENLGERD